MSKKKKIKTNALRMLDRDHIPYEIKEYQYDEEHLSGEHVASQVDMDPGDIYKTLVLEGDNKEYLVCCIPVLEEIDLKALARLSGHKKVEMIHVKDLFDVTGYIRGGCSPVGMKRKLPTYFDASIERERPVAFSAGKRGYQMVVDSKDIVEYVDGETGDLIRHQ